MTLYATQAFDEAGRTGRKLSVVLTCLMIYIFFTSIPFNPVYWALMTTIYAIGLIGSLRRNRCCLLAYFILNLGFHLIQIVANLVLLGAILGYVGANYDEVAEYIPESITVESSEVEEFAIMGVAMAFFVALAIAFALFHAVLTIYSWVLTMRMRRQLKESAQPTTYSPCPVVDNGKDIELANMPSELPSEPIPSYIPTPQPQMPAGPVLMTVVQDANGQQMLVPVQGMVQA